MVLGANLSVFRESVANPVSAQTRRELARTCANPRSANLRELARICRECVENFRKSVANPRNRVDHFRESANIWCAESLRISIWRECASVRFHVTRSGLRSRVPAGRGDGVGTPTRKLNRRATETPRRSALPYSCTPHTPHRKEDGQSDRAARSAWP
eukprot:4301791-Prymnesium_polylepis.1